MTIDFKKTGFRFTDENSIEFYCQVEYFSNYDVEGDIFVSGTFNGWLGTADSSWKMNRKVSKKETFYVLEKDVQSVLVPGNTGFPEFQFYVIGKNSQHYLSEIDFENPYSFHQNKLIFRTEKDLEEIKKLRERPGFIKQLSDFDLNCPACRSEISNVRLVPGTKCLFRGYNPFKKSKSEFDTEDSRIKLVLKAFNLYGINSDITLNGYEGANPFCEEVFPDELKEIEKNNNRLCVNIDYNLVYFHPDAVDYSVALRNISNFIISHPGPYYLHCRLGSDRTGVTAAVFASLCGASWEQIAVDYERTSNMGIGEFRHRNLLQYSLSRLIGRNPCDVKDLAHEVQSYFIKENILSMKEIETLISKLSVAPKKKETDYFDFTGNHICAKKSANM